MDMTLNTGEWSGTPGRSMAKASAPRKRLQGVQVPVHLVDTLEEIQEAENEAYVVMGGESKKSMSEIVSDALEQYASAWLGKHGNIPTTTTERRDFIKRLAESHQRELREQLLHKL